VAQLARLREQQHREQREADRRGEAGVGADLVDEAVG